MSILWTSWIVARRDFRAIVFTPTFLLFLLAPLIFGGFALLGGGGAQSLADSAGESRHMIARVPAGEAEAFRAADLRMRQLARAPRLMVMRNDTADETDIAAMAQDGDVTAILVGSARNARISEREKGSRSGQYLAILAENVAREDPSGSSPVRSASRVQFDLLPATLDSSQASQSTLGYGTMFALFLLVLLLGGQTVGMLAEEKGNKVIEIMAAAAPLEGVFLGKLLAMIATAIVFVGFWVVLGLVFALVAGPQLTAMPPALATTPAVGWGIYAVLTALYGLSAFLLLGAVFLGIGAQANSVREIQMLSLPITLLQLGMFALASSAANAPGSVLASVAHILPWSSPLSMSALAARDPALWPHVLAIAWQALWIAISIRLAVGLFRSGVLKTGRPGWLRRMTGGAGG